MSIARPLLAVVAVFVAVAVVAVPVSAVEVPRASDSDLTIGVVPQRDYDAVDTALMAAAGVDSVRIWLPWSQIEAVRGRYSWGATDEAVRRAAQAGALAFPFLFTEPDWAVELDGHRCSERCITYAPSSATTRDAYARFAGAAVRRYGPDGVFWTEHPELPYLPIHSWQIWNEQNSPYFFRPQPDPELYAVILRSAAREIRAADPNAEIVLGGVFSAEDRPGGLLGSAHYLRELYRVARSFGDRSVGLWVTELGWASRGRRSLGLVTDRSGQARRLARSFARLLRLRDPLNLRGAFWFAWRDTEHGVPVCSWCPHAGLISRAGHPKPAYDALREIALRTE